MNWLSALPQRLREAGSQVLVTVARVDGSAPREPGASMLVGLHDTVDTIGGGHLEWEAIQHARTMLIEHTGTALHRFPLGPRLGQCCGGVVWLVFERIDAVAARMWQTCARRLSQGDPVQRALRAGEYSLFSSADEGTRLQEGEHWAFRHAMQPQGFPLWLFGAGHVGAALARVLPPLGAELTWIDSREDAFGEAKREGVQTLYSDDPASEVTVAPPGTCYLVMTHSHAIDFDVVAAILRRGDAAFCGLIGSRSKRAGFVHRLQARGIATQGLTCPIGIAGIRSKKPEAIAIAVAAQLLQLRDAVPAGPDAQHPFPIETDRA